MGEHFSEDHVFILFIQFEDHVFIIFIRLEDHVIILLIPFIVQIRKAKRTKQNKLLMFSFKKERRYFRYKKLQLVVLIKHRQIK